MWPNPTNQEIFCPYFNFNEILNETTVLDLTQSKGRCYLDTHYLDTLVVVWPMVIFNSKKILIKRFFIVKVSFINP